MCSNIQLIKKEFEIQRGLKPVKVYLTGPPCSGKSFFGQQLGEHYNIPHIHMEKLLQDLLCWDQEKEDNHLKLNSERDRLVAEIKKRRDADAAAYKKNIDEQRAKLESAREEDEKSNEEKPENEDEEKKEGDGENEDEDEAPKAPVKQVEKAIEVKVDGESDDDFEFIDIKEKIKTYTQAHGKEKRIPDELINEAVRWRLNRNDCQNRGYILDGVPKSFQQANDVFVITPKAPEKKKPAEGDEDAEEEPVEEEEIDEEELAKMLKPKL